MLKYLYISIYIYIEEGADSPNSNLCRPIIKTTMMKKKNKTK